VWGGAAGTGRGVGNGWRKRACITSGVRRWELWMIPEGYDIRKVFSYSARWRKVQDN